MHHQALHVISFHAPNDLCFQSLLFASLLYLIFLSEYIRLLQFQTCFSIRNKMRWIASRTSQMRILRLRYDGYLLGTRVSGGPWRKVAQGLGDRPGRMWMRAWGHE